MPLRDRCILLSVSVSAFLCLVMCFPESSEAASRYWVAGSGTWTSTAHWSQSSGGGSGASVPGSSDDVIFDSNSGGGTCTVNATVRIQTLTMSSGNSTAISQGASSFRVDNNATISSQTFTQGSGLLDLNSAFTIDGTGVFAGGSGSIDLQGAFSLSSATASFSSTSGTFFCGNTFTISSGTFTHNSGTVRFDTLSFTISPGSAEFNNVTFYQSGRTFTIVSGQTLTVNGITALTDGNLAGNVSAKGNITVSTAWDGGTGTLTANGTGDQTLTGGGSATSGTFIPFVIDKTSGTLILSGILRTGKNWTHIQGQVNAGTSTVVFAVAALTITPNTMEFYNVTFNQAVAFTVAAGQTMVVSGTLTFTNGTVNTGTISAKGDVSIGAGADGGTAIVSLKGAGSQTITGANGGRFPTTLEIDKPSGTATITGTCNPIYTVNVKQGTLDFTGGFTYYFTRNYTLTVESGANLLLTGSSGSLVTLRRVTSGSGTYWRLQVKTGANYTASYVDVQYSDASPGDRLIYATHSTNSGSTIDWYFIDKIVFTTGAQTVNQNEASAVMTVQLQNDAGVSQNVGEDITIDLSTTSGGGQFSLSTSPFVGIDSVTISSGANSASFYYKDSAAGSPVITCQEEPDYGWDDGVQTETIVSTVAYYTVTADSPQTAGEAFPVTITAKNASGETQTGYTGTADLTVAYIAPDSGTMTIVPSSTSAFSGGVATVSSTYSDCGTISITATDALDPSVTGTTSGVTFYPYDFSVAPSNASVSGATTNIVNQPFSLTITARNTAQAACPNYTGDANLSVNYISPSTSQSGALSTTSLTSGYWTNGIATLASLTYDKYGTITLTCADTTLTTKTGTSGNILFLPKDFTVLLSTPPASRDFYYKDEAFKATVTARDYNASAVSNYAGTVSFSGEGLNLPDEYTFTVGESGSHIFSGINGPEAVDNATITVVDTASASVQGVSDAFDVKEASLKIFSNQGPIGVLPLTVRVIDSESNTITSDDATTFTVTLTETINDGSASSGATASSVTIKGGAATIQVTDNQAETVTVVPTSNPVLTPVAGTATFGTISGAGVGIQVWREIKDKSYEEE